MMEQILREIVLELFGTDVQPQVTRPEAGFGDFSTNIALQLAKPLGRNPREIAEEIASHLRTNDEYESVAVAGPGFINLTLSDDAIRRNATRKPAMLYDGVRYVTEYSCPNAFKELHTGHLYQTILGDVIARLIERSGARVSRTSFGGDVGLHAAKCLYGIVQELGGEYPDKLDDAPTGAFERAAWISRCYVAGSTAYEADETAKEEINRLNKVIYDFHASGITETPLAQIYFTCRRWSYEYFDLFYETIHVDKLRYYQESTTAVKGLELVDTLRRDGKLVESDGAVIYPGNEAERLDTRVFVTSKGIPTYETKDLGVIFMERDDYDFNRRFLITGTEQAAYMRTVFAVADMVQPGIREQMTHIMNGLVKFGDGTKMSSRLGNVASAVDALEVVKAKVRGMVQDDGLVHDIALGAVKYQFLKYRVGGDIAFDVEESVSLQGNSGPYLQYAHARVCSILEKANDVDKTTDLLPFDSSERQLMNKLGGYSEAVERATRELMPHHICNYLYELAQEFNRFYEQARVIGDEREAVRLGIVAQYRDTLAAGLELLGIAAPNRM